MRNMFILCAVAVVAFSFGRDRTVKASDLTGGQGRYQMVQGDFQFADENGTDGRAVAPFLVDTVTGRVWMYNGSDAKLSNNARTAALGVPGFERVEFKQVMEQKDGSFSPNLSDFPQ